MDYSLFLFFSLLASAKLTAGAISKTFDDDVFGVTWGSTLAEVQTIFPEGEVKKYGKLTHYTIEHSKPILKVNRDENKVIFAFNPEGKMHSVGVNFGGSQYSDVLHSASAYFGSYEDVKDSAVVRADWPEDGGIRVYLMLLPSGFTTQTMLTIENTNSLTDASKEELGF